MFINAYEFAVENAEGANVPVALRLGMGGQLKLKKKWNEGTTETLFGAVDDVERMIDVITYALNFTGNKNTITSGEELLDIMAANGLLGMAEKQKLITAIGQASGIFSEKEKESIDKKSERMMSGLFDEEDEKKPKNR